MRIPPWLRSRLAAWAAARADSDPGPDEEPAEGAGPVGGRAGAVGARAGAVGARAGRRPRTRARRRPGPRAGWRLGSLAGWRPDTARDAPPRPRPRPRPGRPAGARPRSPSALLRALSDLPLDLPRPSPGALVAGMTAAALIAIGVLASDAADSAPSEAAALATRAAAADSAVGRPQRKAMQAGLPPDSGVGARVVYSPTREKVWLVGDDGAARRVYRVAAGGTAPSPGVHKVFARRAHGLGGDGAQVEHAVFFAQRGRLNVGFSAPLKGLRHTTGDPVRLGAAIREERADGDALWVFATIGRIVYVVG